MEIYKTYKDRILEAQNPPPDVYFYDPIPDKIRIQVWTIFEDFFEDPDDYRDREIYHEVCWSITKELQMAEGVESLDDIGLLFTSGKRDGAEKLKEVFFRTMNTLYTLSILELICLKIFKSIEFLYETWFETHKRPELALEEINLRMKAIGLGYEFLNGFLIRINSKEVHNEIIKPSLSLLSSDPIYKGSDDEYREAFSFYKGAKYEQVLTECNKAIESCLVAIIEKRGWGLPSKLTMGPLVSKCKSKGLFKSYTENHLNNIPSMVGSVSRIRDEDSGHGKGTKEREIPKELASYVLHLTATNIIFLIESERAMK